MQRKQPHAAKVSLPNEMQQGKLDGKCFDI